MAEQDDPAEQGEDKPADDLTAILEAKRHKATEDAEAMLEAAKLLHDDMEREQVDIEKLKEKQVKYSSTSNHMSQRRI